MTNKKAMTNTGEARWSRRMLLGAGVLLPALLSTAAGAAPRARPEVNAAILTPVDREFAIDGPRLRRHAQILLADGCDTIILFGTTGEANSFSVAQRMAGLEGLLSAGFDPGRLMVGAGCPALADSVALCRHAVGLGCHKLLVLPPYYYKKLGDENLVAWYSQLIDRVGSDGLRLYLYHIPQVSGVAITDGVIEGLLEAYPGTVAGMKDSSGDVDNLIRWIARYPGFEVYSGNERHLPRIFAAGGAGVISAVGNINAAAFRELRDRWVAGGEVDELQAAIHRVRDLFESVPAIPALKHAVAERYGDPDWVRFVPPYLPVPAASAAAFLDRARATRPQLFTPPA